ncbi:hypothetical protein [Streptomyces sp. NPDC093097]|uniref:hypothetical protein n=1 Tax=Streptomyces sp. NPDC093097 TaxID=3366027 RepID=UPI0038301217
MATRRVRVRNVAANRIEKVLLDAPALRQGPIWAEHAERTGIFIGQLGTTRKTERTRLQAYYDRALRVVAEIDVANTTDEERLQIYATALSLLTLEHAALSGQDAEAAKVRVLPRRPERFP